MALAHSPHFLSVLLPYYESCIIKSCTVTEQPVHSRVQPVAAFLKRLYRLGPAEAHALHPERCQLHRGCFRLLDRSTRIKVQALAAGLACRDATSASVAACSASASAPLPSGLHFPLARPFPRFLGSLRRQKCSTIQAHHLLPGPTVQCDLCTAEMQNAHLLVKPSAGAGLGWARCRFAQPLCLMRPLAAVTAATASQAGVCAPAVCASGCLVFTGVPCTCGHPQLWPPLTTPGHGLHLYCAIPHCPQQQVQHDSSCHFCTAICQCSFATSLKTSYPEGWSRVGVLVQIVGPYNKHLTLNPNHTQCRRTLVTGAPASLAVSAATRLASLARSLFRNSTFCSRDSVSRGASAAHNPTCQRPDLLSNAARRLCGHLLPLLVVPPIGILRESCSPLPYRLIRCQLSIR